MKPHGKHEVVPKTQLVEGRGPRALLDEFSLTDKKTWDVYAEIDNSLLDWQMGRGDTSVHIQTRFSRETSVGFARDRFFGCHSHQLSNVAASPPRDKLDRFEMLPSHGVVPSKRSASRADSSFLDDKLPVLASALCDVKKELEDGKSIDDNENQNNMKLGPPDIVGDVQYPVTNNIDSKDEPAALDCSSVSQGSSAAILLCDDRGLESLKRKWTKELEEDSEAYERDIQSLFVTSDANVEMSKRCLSVSNVLRGLSFVPSNDSELARHPGLLAALGRLLLLGHQHPRESRRRCLSRGTDDDDGMTVADDDTPIKRAMYDRWRWDTVDVLREDTLVIFANISGQLDLAAFPEEICIPVLDGLLHWASCSAACALDPMPSTPNGCGPSPRRLALEALCKLCVTDSNVDLLLATPPFRRIVCLLDDLVNILSDAMSDQVAREFAVVLSSSLAAADASAARAIALRRSAISAFLGFIEAADRQAQQLVQAQGLAMLRDNPEMMGTSIDMLRRAAGVIRAVAETTDSRSSLFADHQQRLLQLSMSPTLDPGVAATIAEVLYLCSQTS
jgi:AT-rich interactive domain-containing protein 1